MKLYRFRYSPYARKVQMLLELAHLPHEVIEVRYGEREELARLTGGYIYVPVLVTGDGTVLTESRRICEHVLARPEAAHLVPAPLEAAVWGFHDFVDGPVEDVLFRIATPGVRDAWGTAWERALYTLVKERKFGAGCVDAWAAAQGELLDRARAVLEPTRRVLAEQPFVIGDAPTLADVALYGQWAMLEAAAPDLLDRLSPVFAAHARRLESAR
ncbi:MAG: glutathione S-transferase family protein [Deltaproteobacteria bacterium]|nr:glutathione S-transferase family protein [Deltaproteobacteria bacterium]MCW5807225.1 glutathione S-transferase family protein [Deltaproteobacteria bacterium]